MAIKLKLEDFKWLYNFHSIFLLHEGKQIWSINFLVYVSFIVKIDHYYHTNPDSHFAFFSAVWIGATVAVHDRELVCVLWLSLRARFGARLPVKTRKNEHANCRAPAIKRRSFFRQMAPSIWKRVYLAVVSQRPTYILLLLYHSVEARVKQTPFDVRAL